MSNRGSTRRSYTKSCFLYPLDGCACGAHTKAVLSGDPAMNKLHAAADAARRLAYCTETAGDSNPSYVHRDSRCRICRLELFPSPNDSGTASRCEPARATSEGQTADYVQCGRHGR